MPRLRQRLLLVASRFADGVQLVELLRFPEIALLLAGGADPLPALESLVRGLLVRDGPLLIDRRTLAGEPTRARHQTVVRSPGGNAWRSPVQLELDLLRWAEGRFELARVPALGIEVVAGRAEELPALLEQEVQQALQRLAATRSLEALAWLSRPRELSLEAKSLELELPTTLESAEREERGEVGVLEQVGVDLGLRPPPAAYEVEREVERLAGALGGPRCASVLLVGPPGVGKTALFGELFRRRAAHGLGGRPFWSTSGSRIVAGQVGFGMWQERVTRLVGESSRLSAVLHLGNLVELIEVGRSLHNQLGVASFLRPHLARGELQAVAECTPGQLAWIERQDPLLLQAFQTIELAEPTPAQGRRILERAAEDPRFAQGRLIEPGALETLDRLHRRYAGYSAYPGRPLRLLADLLRDLPPGGRLAAECVTEAFASETGLPRFLLDRGAPFDPAAAREWFAARVVGQPAAVERVVDVITIARAALGRPKKPLASLLFAGPTGVGKTETARALAEYLFGDAARLTRFDMSEYADPGACSRLVGEGHGAEGLLTGRVREQPFSVLLLDELEKAHPLVFDLLLQVTGDGRLTDAGGRVADFTSSVVIMTTNLGASEFLAERLGFGGAAREAQAHFIEAVRAFIRPELMGRIDRIVPFAPLGQEAILRIARREIDALRRRDGIRLRGVRLELQPAALAGIARRGFDSRLGARPLRRAIERELVAPLARALIGLDGQLPLEATASEAQGATALRVSAATDASGRPLAQADAGSAEAALAETAQRLRRRCDALEGSGALRELRSRRGHRRPGSPAEQRLQEAEGRELEALLARVDQTVADAQALEQQVLAPFYRRIEQDLSAGREAAARLEQSLDDLLRRVYCAHHRLRGRITLALFSEEPAALGELGLLYLDALIEEGTQAHVVALLPPDEEARREQQRFTRRTLADPRGELDPPPPAHGLLLELHGPLVCALLQAEAGRHVLAEAACCVELSLEPAERFDPPPRIERRGTIEAAPLRRTYHLGRRAARDEHLAREFPWRGRLEGAVLREILDQTLQAELDRLLEP